MCAVEGIIRRGEALSGNGMAEHMAEDVKSSEGSRKESGRKAERDVPPKRERRSMGRRFVSALGWSFCIGAILYGAVQALSRTAGFRSLLADKLSDRLGVPLFIGGSSLDWRLNVTLEQIQTKEPKEKSRDNATLPQVGADRVEIRWNWSHHREARMIQSMTVEGARIRLVQNEEGAWAPNGLAPLAEKVTRLGQFGMLNNLMSRGRPADEEPPEEDDGAQKKEKQDDLLGNIDVVIRDAEVSWWSGNRQEASITGLDFLSRQVEFPGRQVKYYRVAAKEAALSAGRSMRDISFEMIATDGRNIILGPKASWSAAGEEPKAAETEAQEEFVSQEEALLAHAESVIQRSRETVLEEAVPPSPAMTPTVVPTVIPTATPYVVPTRTPVPVATPTRAPTPTPMPKPTLAPTEAPKPIPAASATAVPPDPMEQALETFAAAQGLTNAPSARSAPEGLSDDESEALILYIKEMLETGE